MEFAFFYTRFNALLIFLTLFYPCKFIRIPIETVSLNYIKATSMDFGGSSNFHESTSTASVDFGGFIFNIPSAVFKPKSSRDIAVLLSFLSASSSAKVSVAARGAGHSIHGQAQAPDGIVIEMDTLPSLIEIHKLMDGEEGFPYADVSGGALWIELLEESLKLGLAPRSWTDYLYLSIGGTLSNAGISGQTFKYGPQITNVLQLEVVTGKGEIVTCSPTQSAELFYAVLGGLGQFGIITRARILLQDAPQQVKWVRLFYDDFQTFIKDQELLILMPDKVDYVEGFIVLNENSLHSSSMAFPNQLEFISELRKDSSKVYYCIEFAVHSHKNEEIKIEQVVDEITAKLRYLPSFIYSAEVSYYDFLNRVRMEEMILREKEQWQVPHPWLNMFVPKYGIAEFKDLLFETISRHDFEGPILLYPLLKDKWDMNTSVVLPEASSATEVDDERVIYVVGLLQSANPSRCTKTCLTDLLERHRHVAKMAASDRIGAKQYLGHQPSLDQWRKHFGSKWDRFADRKSRFDPLALLAPGQGIFLRPSAST
ncbi:cytokinin dehydrogenase 3 isoform X1 [Dendrobium catenatum]|uniref:cytokinin dehydrogenase n=2 Tax=Dendrobium catenatum TaxID=906689 RepID=A0A2I0WUJ6_9ASPA|nr:cytokinin dehydrogenase 3 isoform X1 [Dendrobium catenatum]PKU79321.1 Cytokinin dehydrogenase 3 [Dendrobium catenatum]